MFLAYLTLITALSISGVAIYYSVAGLAAIFAAAVIPIIIMGSVLETAKLVTAVWLHKYWHRCVWWLKAYLGIAVLVLMFITSMGIFGFLSRAHIEQTSLSVEQVAQTEQLTDELDRAESKVARWNEELDRLFAGTDVRVDSLLGREQEQLDSIYARIETEKSQLRQDTQGKIEIQNNRLAQAQARKEQDIAVAQQRFNNAFNRSELDQVIERATANELSVASAVQREIISINRNLADQLVEVDNRFADQVTSVQNRIDQLRSQSTNQTDSIDERINELEELVRQEQVIITDLRLQKAEAEREYRKLEAEVGPIKYIAEFIYGNEADKNLLEEAVRWVIIIIIFVFDPLAVLLLIASQFTFQYIREDKIARGEEIKNSKVDELFGLVEPKFVVPVTEPIIEVEEQPESEPIKKPEPTVEVEQEPAVEEVPEEPESEPEVVEEVTEIEQPKEVKASSDLTVDQIQTTDVTFVETCDGYVKYKDTLIQKDAFKNQHSEWWKSFNASNSGFGTQFPRIAKIGDLFVRVDMTPNKVYKFTGSTWIEVNKQQTDTYLFDEEYIQHLISKIESGEYDLDLLSESERTQIEEYLSR